MNKWILIGFAIMTLSAFTYAKQQVTEHRQELFKKIEDNSEYLEKIIDKQDWSQATSLAQQLSLDVLLLKALFPSNSKGDGRSKEKIWRNKDDFNHRLNEWSLSFKKLAKSTQLKNNHDAEEALDEATSTCRSCHMKYRSLW